MNKTLISNWNSRVKCEDTIFHLGDFCFKNSAGGKKGEGVSYKADYYREQLKGHIIFTAGNHDSNNSLKTPIQKIILRHGGKNICLTHDPKFADFRYDINFTGHVHQLWSVKRLRSGENITDCINVGVDVNNFRPVSFDEIMKRYHKFLRDMNNEIKKAAE